MLALAALLLPAGIFAQYSDDPGIRDTVRLSGGPLVVGQSVPIDVFIYNDEPVNLMAVVLAITSLEGGVATFDSVTYCGRMSDPSVLRWRTLAGERDGLLPDTVLLFNSELNGNEFGAGSSVEMKIYFTGTATGSVKLDSCSNSVGTGLGFVVRSNNDFILLRPYFESFRTPVVSIPYPPELAIMGTDQTSTIGTPIAIEVTGRSSVGGATTISLVSFTSEDDDSKLPTGVPTLSGINPVTLNWTPATGDIGIWKVTFQAVDTSGRQATASVRIQIVADGRYILSFSAVETDSTPLSSGMVVGDLDNDNAPELFMTASPVYKRIGFAAFDITADGECIETYHPDEGFYCYGPQLGYFDNDNVLDAIATRTFQMVVFHGTGDGSFQMYDSLDMNSYSWTSGTLTDFNGDAFLDYATASGNRVLILTAKANSLFRPADSIPLADQGRSINSADFNNDGWEDLAIGTVAGLEIHLNNQGAGYTKAHTYAQTYGSLDIQVTNQGSDFNGDNIYDLCLATPSVGGATSELVVYIGHGDGSFDQRIVRTVKGQIFATSAGDFNADNQLDIAFINGARQYLSILFGDGSGSFLNEVRLAIPKYSPAHMVSLDFDIDGDLDVVVSSYRISEGSALFLFKNELNPTALTAKSLEVLAEDNAKTELVSPSGKIINAVRQSLSSGAFHRRNLNGNDRIDQFVRCAANELGAYHLNMTPKENLPAGSVFSLRYSINGKAYRIVQNVPMPAAGYNFAIYPHDSSPISPALGEYTSDLQPSFSWSGQGPFRFELAADPSFNSLLASVEVTEATYTPTASLPNDDSAIYYWRVRPSTASNWDGFYSFNVVVSPTDVTPSGTDTKLPKPFALGRNYPNPFNPGTTISYDLPRQAQVTLEVFNVVGRKVATLVNGRQEAGHRTVQWDGRDDSGAATASGVYFYRLSAGEFVATAKMVLLK